MHYARERGRGWSEADALRALGLPDGWARDRRYRVWVDRGKGELVELGQMVSAVGEGALVVVSGLDELGRTPRQVDEAVRDVLARGASIQAGGVVIAPDTPSVETMRALVECHELLGMDRTRAANRRRTERAGDPANLALPVPEILRLHRRHVKEGWSPEALVRIEGLEVSGMTLRRYFARVKKGDFEQS